ncbi:MAG: glycerol-3-phosphate dehydrogenase/oxidase [Anaerolineae bacterium]|nr:glycerol-3-phosphate dehydrogenase/oxidase [Anaerolineae bacterium]
MNRITMNRITISARPFSVAVREENLDRLAQETFDVLVIGGGITGVAIARDAAMRGFRTALVEKGDFAVGTSSRSTRLVHGGIRYLEYREFRLVFDACTERRILRQIAPRLVRPLAFLFPLYAGQRPPAWKLRLGLLLYDALSLFRNVQMHRWLSPQEAARREPLIGGRGLLGAGRYYDAQVDDARLTLAMARAAHLHGAVVANYAPVVGLIKAGGRIVGAQVVDARTGREIEVRARIVVNATGVWTDRIRALDDPQARPMLRPTKGIHLLIPRDRLYTRHALIFTSPRDGRHMFVIPWKDFAFIGTTDTDYEGDLDNPAADRSDVEYLLESVNHLVPGARITESDIISTWAGLRPLIAAPGHPSAVSRTHVIVESPSGLLTITGGKLTTARRMAEELTDWVQRRLAEQGIYARSGCRTREPLEGAQIEAVEMEVPDDRVARHLTETYGGDARWILGYLEENPALGEPIVPGLPYLLAEALYAIGHEMALTLSDVLIRRTHVIYEARDGGLSRARTVAGVMAPRLGWDEAEIERQLADYAAQVAQTRIPS